MTYDALSRLWDKEKVIFDTEILGKNASSWEESLLYKNDYQQHYLNIKKFKDNSLILAETLSKFNGKLKNFPNTSEKLRILRNNINDDCIDFENSILKPILDCSINAYDELNSDFLEILSNQNDLVSDIKKSFSKYIEAKKHLNLLLNESRDTMGVSEIKTYDGLVAIDKEDMGNSLDSLNRKIPKYQNNNVLLKEILDNGLRKVS